MASDFVAKNKSVARCGSIYRSPVVIHWCVRFYRVMMGIGLKT